MTTLIEVALPLPGDVASTLMKAVGSVWPNTTIKTDGDDRTLTFDITDEDRKNPKVEEALTEPDYQDDEDGRLLLSSVRDGSLGMTVPEWFTKTLVGVMHEIMEDTTAENYLEWTLTSGDRSYAVVLCRTTDATPHSLRKAADERSERYAEKLKELGVDPDTI